MDSGTPLSDSRKYFEHIKRKIKFVPKDSRKKQKKLLLPSRLTDETFKKPPVFQTSDTLVTRTLRKLCVRDPVQILNSIRNDNARLANSAADFDRLLRNTERPSYRIWHIRHRVYLLLIHRYKKFRRTRELKVSSRRTKAKEEKDTYVPDLDLLFRKENVKFFRFIKDFILKNSEKFHENYSFEFPNLAEFRNELNEKESINVQVEISEKFQIFEKTISDESETITLSPDMNYLLLTNVFQDHGFGFTKEDFVPPLEFTVLEKFSTGKALILPEKLVQRDNLNVFMDSLIFDVLSEMSSARRPKTPFEIQKPHFPAEIKEITEFDVIIPLESFSLLCCPYEDTFAMPFRVADGKLFCSSPLQVHTTSNRITNEAYLSHMISQAFHKQKFSMYDFSTQSILTEPELRPTRSSALEYYKCQVGDLRVVITVPVDAVNVLREGSALKIASPYQIQAACAYLPPVFEDDLTLRRIFKNNILAVCKTNILMNYFNVSKRKLLKSEIVNNSYSKLVDGGRVPENTLRSAVDMLQRLLHGEVSDGYVRHRYGEKEVTMVKRVEVGETLFGVESERDEIARCYTPPMFPRETGRLMYTFEPDEDNHCEYFFVDGLCNRKDEDAAEKKCEKEHTLTMKLKYCHAFLKNGECTYDECKYDHFSPSELEEALKRVKNV